MSMEPKQEREAKHTVLYRELERLDREVVQEYRAFLVEIKGEPVRDEVTKAPATTVPPLAEVLEMAPEQIAIAIKDMQAILEDLRGVLF